MTGKNFSRTARITALALGCGTMALLAGCTANSNGVLGNNGNGNGQAPDVSSFKANPNQLTKGNSTTLTWDTKNAQSCLASGGDLADKDGWSGSGPKPVKGSFTTPPLNTPGIYTYTLTCTAADGISSAKNVDVVVSDGTSPTPPAVNFSATPTTVVAGNTTVLSWSSSNAQSCVASGGDTTDSDGWAGTTGTSNKGFTTQPLITPGTYTYALTCTAKNGSNSTSQIPVMVVASHGGSSSSGGSSSGGSSSGGSSSGSSSGGGGSGANIPLTATPATIPYDTGSGTTTANLVWNQPDASACTLTDPKGNPVPGVPTDSYSGNVPVTIDTTTPGTSTYTLQCTNATTGKPDPAQTATITVSQLQGAIPEGPGNDGTIPTTIDNGGKPVPGHFICTLGTGSLVTDPANPVTTAVGTKGLVGGPLTGLLNGLGGSTATDLLNSVKNTHNVIDDKIPTYATFSLAAGGLSILDSVDLDVLAPTGSTIPAGGYAVFAITFPGATVNLSLGKSITVSTFLDKPGAPATTPQETISVPKSQLGLLGSGGDQPAFIGLKTTKPYNRAALEVNPGLLSAVVGPSLYANEFCVGGKMVTP